MQNLETLQITDIGIQNICGQPSVPLLVSLELAILLLLLWVLLQAMANTLAAFGSYQLALFILFDYIFLLRNDSAFVTSYFWC